MLFEKNTLFIRKNLHMVNIQFHGTFFVVITATLKLNGFPRISWETQQNFPTVF